MVRAVRTPAQRAAHTAKWATTMAKWGVSHASGGHRRGTRAVVRWQLVDFPGQLGGESRGIVDALAIRKDHHLRDDGLERGDRLEIVLLQIKGGSAPRPSESDLVRLRRVARLHRAADVVLVEWRLREVLTVSLLRHGKHPRSSAWAPSTPEELFGSKRSAKRSW